MREGREREDLEGAALLDTPARGVPTETPAQPRDPGEFSPQSAEAPVGRLRGENGEGDGTEPELYTGSAEAFAIADMAKALGHEVRVVPSALAPSLGVGARKIKTDKRDAQILSEVSCQVDLQSVHIPSDRARELKAICALRETIVESRTKLIRTR